MQSLSAKVDVAAGQGAGLARSLAPRVGRRIDMQPEVYGRQFYGSHPVIEQKHF
ncbi:MULTISPECIES: hypothetical protein [Paraburkholderia]|uniref:hypothetical protein n=1 Tax=Paraburkholderia TaxID=1822464 RepID=UPI001CC8114F|nr:MULTISPECIES: hypothetical protein [Paraburkholderia]